MQWIGYLDGAVLPRFILDLKKCVEASPRKIKRAIDFDGWGTQAAAYSLAVEDGLNIPYFVIAADNDYQVCVMKVSQGKRLEKIQHLNWYIDRFLDCLFEPALFQQSYGFYVDGGVYEH